MSVPEITSFALGDYQTNCFVVTVPPSPRCWIIDCGYEPNALFNHIEHAGLEPVALLLTHAHSDHMASVDAARTRFGNLPVSLHRAETAFLTEPMLNLSAMLGVPVTAAPPDVLLDGGETLELEGTHWRVVHAPGHSPGSVLFIHDASNQAIVGDTLFAGSIGRSDFPTSDVDDLRHTITQTMMALPDDMTIHPGHGPKTTIGTERQSNPFVRGGF